VVKTIHAASFLMN